MVVLLHSKDFFGKYKFYYYLKIFFFSVIKDVHVKRKKIKKYFPIDSLLVFNRFNLAKYYSLYQASTRISNAIYRDIRWVVRFVHFGRIVSHHCLNSLSRI
jgi:hypothetical protein